MEIILKQIFINQGNEQILVYTDTFLFKDINSVRYGISFVLPCMKEGIGFNSSN